MDTKIIRCECGFFAQGTEAQVVSALQHHVREFHNLELTDEQARAMAEPVEGVRS